LGNKNTGLENATRADLARWYCLRPMDKFEPAPHHRRLRLQLKPNVTLPKADPRPTPIGHQQLEREFTQLLLDQGRICPSNSPTGAPMLFVPKPIPLWGKRI
jgi:hypothetical protein